MNILDHINGDEIFRKLFEYSTVGMSITTLDGKLHANAAFCEMIGYTKEELLDREWTEITHPEDIAFNHKVIESILSNERQSDRWEKRYLHKDGSTIWVDIHTYLFRDTEDNPLYFITTVNNITERRSFEEALAGSIAAYRKAEEEIRQQNEQLKQSNAEKDKFFAILAHDLRSPLSTFLGLAEVMAEDINSMTRSEVEEISKSLCLSASNLFQLLENLLEWSILRRGIAEYHPEPSILNKLILRCMEPFQETARRKNISLSMELNQTYTVFSDLKMTETIFRNLISNALKYTQSGGSVVLTARQVSPEEVEICVTDTGIGMNAELRSKLFIVNEQVSRKGTDGEASSGLGLLICKEFVDRQGGRIWVESEEKMGSTFHFTLKNVT